MTAQHRGQIELAARPVHQADQNQPPALRERLDISRQVGAADTIQNHVHPPPFGRRLHRRGERPAFVLIATSAPSLRHCSHFSSAPAVTITRTPASLSNRIDAVPMPLPPP